MDYVQPIGAAPGAPYVDANPGIGLEGSAVPAAALEHPQREIMAVIAAAGIAPDAGTLTQLRDAIALLILAANPGALPRAYIAGMALANNGAAPATAIDFAPGAARDAANGHDLVLAAAMTKTLQAAGAWAAGTGANGLFSGARANSTWYHCFAIRKDADGSIDCGFDTSPTAANRPAGYTAYRRVGAVRTDGAGNVLPFHQVGFDFFWAAPLIDVAVTNLGNTSSTYTLGGVPSGVRCLADLFIYGGGGASSSGNVYVRSTDQTDLAPPAVAGVPSAAPATINQIYGTGDIADVASGTHCRILTDTSAQIAARASNANAWLYIHTRGYRDYL